MPKKVAKKCLICGNEETRVTRGLCVKHYNQFQRHRETLTKSAAEEWEADLIEAGKLLPNRQGKSSAEENAFADIYADFVSKHPGAVRTVSPEEVAEAETANEAAEKAVQREKTRAKASPKKKSTRKKKSG